MILKVHHYENVNDVLYTRGEVVGAGLDLVWIFPHREKPLECKIRVDGYSNRTYTDDELHGMYHYGDHPKIYDDIYYNPEVYMVQLAKDILNTPQDEKWEIIWTPPIPVLTEVEYGNCPQGFVEIFEAKDYGIRFEFVEFTDKEEYDEPEGLFTIIKDGKEWKTYSRYEIDEEYGEIVEESVIDECSQYCMEALKDMTGELRWNLIQKPIGYKIKDIPLPDSLDKGDSFNLIIMEPI